MGEEGDGVKMSDDCRNGRHLAAQDGRRALSLVFDGYGFSICTSTTILYFGERATTSLEDYSEARRSGTGRTRLHVRVL